MKCQYIFEQECGNLLKLVRQNYKIKTVLLKKRIIRKTKQNKNSFLKKNKCSTHAWFSNHKPFIHHNTITTAEALYNLLHHSLTTTIIIFYQCFFFFPKIMVGHMTHQDPNWIPATGMNMFFIFWKNIAVQCKTRKRKTII